MDDLWLRALIVAGALGVAVMTAVIARRRAGVRNRRLEVDLPDGVYFFSSQPCASCLDAREKLDASLGADGYTEIAWEREGELFDELGIDVVPATMVVTEGRGRLKTGQPGRLSRRR